MKKRIAQKVLKFQSENLKYCVVVSRGKETWQFNYTQYELASAEYKNQMYEEANMCSICGLKSVIGLYRQYTDEIICGQQIVISGLNKNF